MPADPAPVTIRIRRGWAVLEGVAAVLAAVAAGTDLAVGSWVTGVVFVVLTGSLGFQTAQAWGTLTVDGEGVDDDRVFGPGRVGWQRVERVRVGNGGWVRPPLLIDVEQRARPVAASSPWTLDVRVGDRSADWERAREAVRVHARAAGVPVESLG